jgi:hypothetical protein
MRCLSWVGNKPIRPKKSHIRQGAGGVERKSSAVFLYSPNENQVTSPYVEGYQANRYGSLYYVTHAQVIK